MAQRGARCSRRLLLSLVLPAALSALSIGAFLFLVPSTLVAATERTATAARLSLSGAERTPAQCEGASAADTWHSASDEAVRGPDEQPSTALLSGPDGVELVPGAGSFQEGQGGAAECTPPSGGAALQRWDLFRIFNPLHWHLYPKSRQPRRRKRAKRLVLTDGERREIQRVDAQILGAARELINTTGHSEVDRPGKIAFLFLTRGPMPLGRLWRRFFRGHQGEYVIHIHSSDVNHTAHGRAAAFRGFRVRGVPGVRIAWGSLTMVTATRRLLAAALHDLDVQRFVLLSETCIPVRNFTTIRDYLFSSHSSYIDSGRTGWRYNQKLSPVITRWQWHKGSQWFVLIRHHAELLVEDDLYFNQFDKAQFFIADEHYAQTVLPLLDPGRLIRRSLTFRQLEADSWHPLTYGKNNLTADFIRDIQQRRHPFIAIGAAREPAAAPPPLPPPPPPPLSDKDVCRDEAGEEQPCFLFARKFAPLAVGPLLRMSGILGF